MARVALKAPGARWCQAQLRIRRAMGRAVGRRQTEGKEGGWEEEGLRRAASACVCVGMVVCVCVRVRVRARARLQSLFISKPLFNTLVKLARLSIFIGTP